MGKIVIKRKKALIAVLTCLIIVGSIVYALADRYLIEHVEGKVIDPDISPSRDERVNIMDDWNYVTDYTSIKIRKETEGYGDNKATYYVADIELTEGTDFLAGFAENKFGRNIIENTSVIARNNDAIFAINGDYYGFRDNGIIIRNGVLYRNKPCRTGLAMYKNGTMKIYDERKANPWRLIEDGVWNTYSFGPALLEDSIIPDKLKNVKIDKNLGNRSIHDENPRTGIGIIDKNHFIIIVVDGRSPGYSRGLTMMEYAKLFKDLGCTDAYNLDGGGSATMYFRGRVVNNPLGKKKERGVSDILYIK